MSLSILGLGCYLPKTEISNDFLHQDVGLSAGPRWVESRLGIRNRYSVLSKDYILKTKNENPAHAILHARSNGETPVTMGVRAAQAALKMAGLSPDQLGWVIANNDTPFETIPSTASFIAKALGVRSGPHCDVNSACSSFARHMQLLGSVKESELPEFVLSVQTSAYTVRTSYAEHSIDGYIWGDGASAEILSARHPGKLTVEPMIFESDPAGADQITIDSTGHFAQDGAAVREFSIRKTCEMFEEISEKKNVPLDRAYTVAHQANYVMQDSIIGHLGIPESRHLRNVHLQGNIAAAGCPSVIAQSLDRLHSGDSVIYAVLGSGLAWGGGYMEVN